MLGLGKHRDQFGERQGLGNRDNVSAWNRDFSCGPIAKMEQIAQHLAFNRGQVAALGRFAFGRVDGLFDLVPQAGLMIIAEDQRPHSAPQSRTGLVRMVRHHARSR